LRFRKEQNRFIGTPRWNAPEIILQGDLTEKVDVYSFGTKASSLN
jgi:serine/threonine protein kinase